MGIFPEYDRYDAVGLAELVRKKEVSAAELCEEAISRIGDINPKINAVVLQMFDSARKAARSGQLKGVFAGVPFLARDLLTTFTGIPLSLGKNSGSRGKNPEEDSELMRRFRKTGIIVLGETNSPESCLSACASKEFAGPARNPWNPDYETGSSCGGAAAAVSSGMVPFAAIGDACGSLRIPSSCCGLFGLKPSRGRTPAGPFPGEVWQGTLSEHVVARSVRDSAAMLDAIQGPDAGAPYVIAGPQRPYLKESSRDPGSLRIAFTSRSPLSTEIHPECRLAVENAAHLLESLGHRVEEAEPALDAHSLAKSIFMLHIGETSADISELRSVLGRNPVASDLEDAAWVFKLLGDAFSAGEFVLAMRAWNATIRQMGLFFNDYDLYLTPTLASPPARIGSGKSRPFERLLSKIVGRFCKADFVSIADIIDEVAVESMERNPFTQIANIAGLPAMSVPLHWTADGLPCGVQFIGHFGAEDALFRLAAQLEEARPWFSRQPAISDMAHPVPGRARPKGRRTSPGLKLVQNREKKLGKNIFRK